MPEKIEETPLRRISREVGDSGLFSPEVHRLYEAGKARKAQAVFKAQVAKELNSGRKRRQQQYLDDTYLWLDPLGSAPSMHTVNGIGTMLYGNYKPNPDGVHIATLWFVFVFLPVFPIAAYVVRKAGGNSWTFYAKAPLPPFARIWRVGIGGVIAAAAIAIGAMVAWDSSHAELWLYNGFEVPVQVSVEQDSFELAPHQIRKAGDYALGPVTIVSTPEGWTVPIEQVQPNLDLLGDDELLYNIAGRASLVRGWVVYGPGSTRDDELLGTETFVPVGSVDYLLREPPMSKEVREGSSIVDEVVYNAEDEVPFSVAAFFTQSMVSPDDAWRMLQARLAVNPGDREALALISTMKPSGDPELLAMGELARAGNPDDVEAHRLYQNCLGQEQADAVRQEYLDLASEHADSAMYQYLAGRLLDDAGDEAEQRFRKALELDPGFPYAHLALGYQLATRGDLDPAIDAYGRYAQLEPSAAADVLRSRVRLLQARGAEGWLDAAQALVDETQLLVGEDAGLAGLQATLAVRHGTQPLAEVLDGLEAALSWEADGEIEAGSAALPAQLDACMAAGDVERARALLVGLDPELDGWVLAKGDLFLALAGGEPAAVNQALDTHLEMLAAANTSQALYAAAAAQALGHSGAEALLELAQGLERPGSVSPAVVLAPDAALDTAGSLDSLLAPVPFDGRGLAYAAAAVRLQHSGADPAMVAHARSQAAHFALPDELPPW